jgi:hypothetical protein
MVESGECRNCDGGRSGRPARSGAALFPVIALARLVELFRRYMDGGGRRMAEQAASERALHSAVARERLAGSMVIAQLFGSAGGWRRRPCRRCDPAGFRR